MMSYISSILDALPPEVIIHVLEKVDIPTLIKCRKVCRTFHTLIESSAKLKYDIELFAACQEDGPPGSTLPATRLQMLQAHQEAWSHLQWTSRQRIPMSTGGLWELFGNVLAQFDADATLRFLQLPSNLRKIPEHRWFLKDLGVKPRDFGMDPSQDLLVLIENPRWDENDTLLRIHLRTMSTGESHPLALKPGVLTYEEQYVELRQVSYTIQISGEFLGFLISGVDAWPNGRHELVIQNWKTGETIMTLYGESLRSYAFLGTHHVIAVGVSRPDFNDVLLQVFDLSHFPKQRELFPSEVGISFGFPEFSAAAVLPEILIRSDPTPSWRPSKELGHPFFIDRSERLYVITFFALIGNAIHSMNLFVPSKTFLQSIESARPRDDEPASVSWSQWGPQGTHLAVSNSGIMNVWVCYVHGMKYVEMSENNDAVVMYDFNPVAVRRELHTRNSCDDDEYTVCVLRPDIVRRPRIFAGPVETFLPFRQMRRRVGLISPHVMCSEDSLVLLEKDERFYHVLTF